MSDKKYKGFADASTKLKYCLVRYKGVPFYVTGISEEEENCVGEVYNIVDSKVEASLITVCYNDTKDLSVESFSGDVGYINLNGDAGLIKRTPLRFYKEGLNQNTTSFSPVCSINSDRPYHSSFNFNIAQSYWGLFPKFKEFRKNHISSMALSNTFAVSNLSNKRFISTHNSGVLTSIVDLKKGSLSIMDYVKDRKCVTENIERFSIL